SDPPAARAPYAIQSAMTAAAAIDAIHGASVEAVRLSQRLTLPLSTRGLQRYAIVRNRIANRAGRNAPRLDTRTPNRWTENPPDAASAIDTAAARMASANRTYDDRGRDP